jgi:hypothetical protein
MADLAEDAADDAALESLGYKQELSRGMTWLCVRHARATATRCPACPQPRNVSPF